jgi:hypothetical protein
MSQYGSCVVVWIAPRQLGVAKKVSRNRLQWLKMEDLLSSKLVVDESFQQQRYDPDALLAEGPMPIRGLQDVMISTILDNPRCAENKLLFLKQLQGFLLPISFKFWSEKLAPPIAPSITPLDLDEAHERPLKKRTLFRNNLLTMKPDCLFLILSFLIAAMPSNQESKIVLNLLKVSKALYNCRADLFSNYGIQLSLPLAYLQSIADFNPRSLTLYNHYDKFSNFTSFHLEILQKMTKLKNLNLSVHSEVSLDSLEHVVLLVIRGWDDKRTVRLPKNLVSLSINACNRISRINGVYLKLEELTIHTDSKLGKEVRFEAHQFPALRSLDVRNCHSFYPLPDDLTTSLQVLRIGTSVSFKELARLGNLQVLDAYTMKYDCNNDYTWLSTQNIGAKLKNLKFTSFNRYNLDDLKCFTSLLTLHFTASLMLQNISAVLYMPLLQSLVLKHCPHLASIDCLVNLTNLTELELQDCPAVGDLTVVCLIPSLRIFAYAGFDHRSFDRENQIRKIRAEKPHLIMTFIK